MWASLQPISSLSASLRSGQPGSAGQRDDNGASASHPLLAVGEAKAAGPSATASSVEPVG